MKNILWILAPAMLLLSGCSGGSETAQKKEAEKPPEPVTGQTAVYRMYRTAKTWAADAMVIKMNSIFINELKDVPRGKAGAWEATFYSPSTGTQRAYTYSVVEQLPTLHKDVFAQTEMRYTGLPKAPFQILAVKIDSDKAYETALAKSEDYDKKNPGKPILVLLERNMKYPDPVWRIVWGESVGTSGFSVYVDASTGDFLEKMH